MYIRIHGDSYFLVPGTDVQFPFGLLQILIADMHRTKKENNNIN